MSRGRWMLISGGVILLVASVGLSALAGATVRSLEILGWRIGEPPPASLGQLDYMAGLAGLFALGWIVACAGISSPGPGGTVTGKSRMLYAAAGLLTIVGALPLAFGVVTIQRMFMLIATSASTPKYEVVERTISHCIWYPILGFGIAALAAVFVLLAGIAGLRKADAQHERGPAPVRSMITIGATAFFAVLFALCSILISRHGAALEIVLADSSLMPKPTELARHLEGILSKSLCAYLILVLLGIVQIVAAALAPAASSDNTLETTA